MSNCPRPESPRRGPYRSGMLNGLRSLDGRMRFGRVLTTMSAAVLVTVACTQRPDLLRGAREDAAAVVFVQQARRIQPESGVVRLRRLPFSVFISTRDQTVSVAATVDEAGLRGPLAGLERVYVPKRPLTCDPEELCASREPLEARTMEEPRPSHAGEPSGPDFVIESARHQSNLLDVPGAPLKGLRGQANQWLTRRRHGHPRLLARRLPRTTFGHPGVQRGIRPLLPGGVLRPLTGDGPPPST